MDMEQVKGNKSLEGFFLFVSGDQSNNFQVISSLLGETKAGEMKGEIVFHSKSQREEKMIFIDCPPILKGGSSEEKTFMENLLSCVLKRTFYLDQIFLICKKEQIFNCELRKEFLELRKIFNTDKIQVVMTKWDPLELKEEALREEMEIQLRDKEGEKKAKFFLLQKDNPQQNAQVYEKLSQEISNILSEQQQKIPLRKSNMFRNFYIKFQEIFDEYCSYLFKQKIATERKEKYSVFSESNSETDDLLEKKRSSLCEENLKENFIYKLLREIRDPEKLDLQDFHLKSVQDIEENVKSCKISNKSVELIRMLVKRDEYESKINSGTFWFHVRPLLE